MEAFSLTIEKRDASGSSASRRFRVEGKLPANVYHKKKGSISVVVNRDEFTKVAKKARISQVFAVKSEDKELNGAAVIVKDIQREYQKRQLLHVDFQLLIDNEPVVVNVPLELVGEAPGVKGQGGVLSQMLHDSRVRCLPKDIPATIPVDVSSLVLGKSIHKGDVEMPKGVTLVDEPKETIVTVVGTRASRMMSDEDSEEEAS